MVPSASEAEIRVPRQITAATAVGTAPEALLTWITRAAARLCERRKRQILNLLVAGGTCKQDKSDCTSHGGRS